MKQVKFVTQSAALVNAALTTGDQNYDDLSGQTGEKREIQSNPEREVKSSHIRGDKADKSGSDDKNINSRSGSVWRIIAVVVVVVVVVVVFKQAQN